MRAQRRSILLALGLALLFALAGPLAAQVGVGTIDLHAARDAYPVAPQLEYFVDASNRLGLAEVRAAEREGRFSRNTRSAPTFGFARGTFWFALRVRNVDHADPAWVVAIAYALLDRADLFVIRSDGSVETFRSGDRHPFASRALAHRHITFPLRLGRGESAELYLRVRSESSIQVPLQLATVEAFLASAPAEHLGLGLYYGIMLGLLLYNLVLFVSVRDRTFLLYVLYVGVFALGQLCLNGIAYEYLWPESPAWANTAVLVTIGLGMICMLEFTRSFLNLRETFPTAAKAVRITVLALALILVAIPVLGYRRTILLETALVFVIATLIMGSAIVVYRNGFKPARNFLIAWSVLLLGVVVYAAVSFGVLPKVFITEYGIQIGSAAEMILLSFALAYRINTLREENARIQQEARDQLESRVAERTRELDTAMHQLRHANNALRDFSLRDGLTGVHNRRYMDSELPEQWERAREKRGAISLLMVDIDHFKRINDQYGHLVGDDCLRAVAQSLIAQLEGTRAHIVRYGGEEFVVILPDSDTLAAVAIAERIRAAVPELRVYSEGIGVNLTVSIGVASFDRFDGLLPSDLLRITDRALYEAKRRGRDRVVASRETER